MENGAHRRRLILYGCLTLLIMAFIYIMSAQDGEHSENLSNGFLRSLIGEFLERILPQLTGSGAENDIRKYAHVSESFCLGCSSFLFFHEWLLERAARVSRALVRAAVFSLLYACTDELHQTFVPGRAGMLKDVLIDGIGIFFGVLLMGALAWLQGKNRTKTK